jgi:hypothetical protein
MHDELDALLIDYDSDELDDDSDDLVFSEEELDYIFGELDYDVDESDDDSYLLGYSTFNKLGKNPRIKRLRRNKEHGIAPPYCATAPALFPRNTPPSNIKRPFRKPTPLRNITLSNVPKEPPPEPPQHSLIFRFLCLARLGAIYIVDGLRRAWTKLPFRSGCPSWHSTTGLTSNKPFTVNIAIPRAAPI